MLQSHGSTAQATGFLMTKVGSRLTQAGVLLMEGKVPGISDMPLVNMFMGVCAEMAAQQANLDGDDQEEATEVESQEAEQETAAKPRKSKSSLADVDVAMPEGVEIVPIKATWFKENDPWHHFTPEGVEQWRAYHDLGLSDRQIGKAMGITEGASYQRRRALKKKDGPKEG